MTQDILFATLMIGGIGLVVAFGLCYLFRVPEMKVVTGLVGKLTGRFGR